MRFINLIVGLFGVTTALQDVDPVSNVRHVTPVQNRATGKSTKCTSKRFMPRGALGGYDETDNSWQLYMNDYCEAEDVDNGQKVVILDVSGCSAVFFFGSDGKPTAYHVEAGKEASEGKEAATIAVKQKSTSSCVIYAYEQAKATALQTAFRGAGYTTTCKYMPYKLDTSNKNARWKFSLEVPSTSITATPYTCA